MTDSAAVELTTINPATEEILNKHTIMKKEEVNAVAKKSNDAYQEWEKDLDKRIDFLYDVAKQLRNDKENLARTPTNETDKALKEAKTEVDTCVFIGY